MANNYSLTMTELSIHGPDGLFHNIVKFSAIMEGRYAVLEKGTQDLNLNVLLTRLEIPQSNFPGVFCLAPTSEIEGSMEEWETFNYRVLFLDTTGSTGDNQIAEHDPLTNSSMQRIISIWDRMKVAALNFIHALEIVQQDSAAFNLGQKYPYKIVRVTSVGKDNLSGVVLAFNARLFTACTYTDINMKSVMQSLRAEDGQFLLNETGATL